MRLKTIKLAGFKSFVDPTTIALRSQLTAIIGPNGCGKSNVVDAIRWVIGESSAKQLRGELLTDVIFNGTTHRKPVSQAAIELLFDNSKGGLGGPYDQYNEIGIRREITRDGQSQFYLNSTRCRRRDITDLFLGTGLGPNSYAIIEQGVVSQLIEGKPEDIRIYLEEAAGISKYRERRRETENRIRNTRENLNRLTDLRNELGKQLEHLKRQATAAERFKALKQQQHLLKAQWHALHWHSLDRQLVEQDVRLHDHTIELEGQTTEQLRMDGAITEQRQHQVTIHDSCNTLQAQYYQLGSDITRQEQQIQHIQASDQQLNTDLAQLTTNWAEAEQHLVDDHAQIAALQREVIDLIPKIEEAVEVANDANAQLQQAAEQRANWQHQWEIFQAEAHQIDQQAQLEQSRLQHLSQKIQGIEQRIQRLEQQRQEFHIGSLPSQIAELSEQTTTLEQHLILLQQTTLSLNQRIQQQREVNKQQHLSRDQCRKELSHSLNRQASLEALQQAALGKADQGVSAWLEQQGWAEKPRLLDGLEVTPGWEIAVETVLGTYLEAVCTDNALDLRTAAEHLTKGRLTLVNIRSLIDSASLSADPPATISLASQIHSQWPIAHLFAGTYLVEDIAHALTIVPTLTLHQSVVTRSGVWFGPNWVRVSQVQDETTGVLQRKQALQELTALLTAQQQQLEAQEQALQDNQEALLHLEKNRDQQQHDYQENLAKHSELRARLSTHQANLTQLQQRETITNQELHEHQQQLTLTQQQYQATEIAKEHAQQQQQELHQQRCLQLETKEILAVQCQALQQQTQRYKQSADELQVRRAATQNQLHYLQQNVHRAEKQLVQLEERRTALSARQTEIILPLTSLTATLQQALTERLLVEKTLFNEQEKRGCLEQSLRTLEKQRSQLERETQVTRDHLAQIRITQSTLQTHRDHHQQQLQEIGFELNNVLQELPTDATEAVWQQELTQTENRIQRLGAINLAAIEEYNTLLERKTYLDDQDKDICDALTTLEEAIRKIDRESRTRLRATFDCVNEHFKQLFVTVFGGGFAELELTEEEVLNAGVVIRAQPPGKRNSLLHLLSGGEKALTAIALVFALFQLNPAPFCVLDEVDAPLDEANVARFCHLVKSMSATVQFIFISHNKITMEMAEELVGVTMQEPGVSRLVSVNIDEAIAMAAEGENQS